MCPCWQLSYCANFYMTHVAVNDVVFDTCPTRKNLKWHMAWCTMSYWTPVSLYTVSFDKCHTAQNVLLKRVQNNACSPCRRLSCDTFHRVQSFLWHGSKWRGVVLCNFCDTWHSLKQFCDTCPVNLMAYCIKFCLTPVHIDTCPLYKMFRDTCPYWHVSILMY